MACFLQVRRGLIVLAICVVAFPADAQDDKPEPAEPEAVKIAQPAEVVKDSDITYRPPADWKQLPAGPLLKDSYEIKQGDAAAKVSIASLPTRNKLLENISRWGVQLELPYENASKALENAKTVTLDNQHGKLVELHNPINKQRILAAIVTEGKQDWFFKMMGDQTVVEKQQKTFEEFLKTVKFIEKDAKKTAGSGR